jgi:hypothetical protein
MIELKIATVLFDIGVLISFLTTNVGHERVSELLAGLAQTTKAPHGGRNAWLFG